MAEVVSAAQRDATPATARRIIRDFENVDRRRRDALGEPRILRPARGETIELPDAKPDADRGNGQGEQRQDDGARSGHPES
jgi:hypothetical protein